MSSLNLLILLISANKCWRRQFLFSAKDFCISVVDDEEVQSCWVIFHLIIVESKTLLEDQSLLLGRRCAPHEMWTLIMINSRSRLCIYFVIIWLIRKRLVIWNEAEEIKYYKQHPGSSDPDHCVTTGGWECVVPSNNLIISPTQASVSTSGCYCLF